MNLEQFANKVINIDWNDFPISTIEIRHQENSYVEYMIKEGDFIPSIIAEDISKFNKKFNIRKIIELTMTYQAKSEKILINIEELEYDEEKTYTLMDLLGKGYSLRQANEYFKEKENKDYAQR